MTFTSLASSSAGNAYVVSDGETTLLLECGLSARELCKRLGGLSAITACLVSHDHQDHAHAAKQLLKRGVPVYMSYGTACRHKDAMDAATLISAGQEIAFGALRVKAFSTFHNTLEPLGFVIWDTRTEERLLFAVDTANLAVRVAGLTHIAIECNYQDELLGASYTPELLRARIRRSHFEAGAVLRYLYTLDLSRCEQIYLLHLSNAHTCAEELLERFSQAFPGIEITICKA